jgi:hypothetical protein
MTTQESNEQACAYVRKIRNQQKRAYAERFHEYLANGRPLPEHDEFTCSYMAKQAVQIRLYEILRSGCQ